MRAPNAILDHPASLGQLAMSVRVDVLDVSLSWQGSLTPFKAGTIRASTSGAVNRSWTGLVVSETDYETLDAPSARLRPAVVLEDGSGPPGSDVGGWPLGVYVIVDAPRSMYGEQPVRTLSLLDLGFALDQNTAETFSVEPGADIYDALIRLLDDARIYQRFVDPAIGARVWEAAAWQAGTSRKTIADRLAQLGGVLPPYIANDGTCVVRSSTELRTTAPDHVYNFESGRIIAAPPPVENQNLLDAPNLHVVKGTGPTGGPIVATATVDPRYDWSIERRGFAITEIHTLQGLDGTDAAQRAADNFAAIDVHAHHEVEFSGYPDPRHDIYDVVEYQGTNWRETGWTLGLDPGNRIHSHTLTQDQWEYGDQ